MLGNTRQVCAAFGALVAAAVLGLVPACSSIGPAARVDGEPVATPMLVARLAAEQEASIRDAREPFEQAIDPELLELSGSRMPSREELEASILGQLVLTEVVHQQLEAEGESITAADRGAAWHTTGDLLEHQNGQHGPLSEAFIGVQVEFAAAMEAVERAFASQETVTTADAREVYDQDPLAWGEQWCTTLLVVPDDAVGELVTARFEAGDTAEDIASFLRADPATVDERTGDIGCRTLDELDERFGLPDSYELGDAVATTPEGSLSGLVRIAGMDGGPSDLALVHVQQVQPVPFAEAQGDVYAELEAERTWAGQERLINAAAGADVWIDPDIGTWEPDVGVVPPGGLDDPADEEFEPIAEEIRT
jgi:hypothetical protein